MTDRRRDLTVRAGRLLEFSVVVTRYGRTSDIPEVFLLSR